MCLGNMTNENQVHAWVFRNNKESVSTRKLIDSLARLLDAGSSTGSGDVSALIAAGELECALADAADPVSTFSAQLTDALAAATLDPRFANRVNKVAILSQIASVMRTTCADSSPAEGFAYYALHPLQFAKAIGNPPSNAAAIIGIRSIGTVLSAVLAMALARRGCDSSRITVRPQGHPYDRRTSFDEEQIRWIKARIEGECDFFVVDEGPGLSGSSFLSVAEALEREGVPAERIALIGTREPDPARLCAPDATRRWARFRFHCVPSKWTDEVHCTNWSGGVWRNALYLTESSWPACWTQMESLKFRSEDSSALSKFEGLGHFGDVARDRARTIFAGGFGPKLLGVEEELSRYGFVPGALLTRSDVSSNVLEQIAKYCAFRASAFPAAKADFKAMSEMARFNCAQGVEAQISEELLATRTPVIVDGRMHPHEWIRTLSGHIYKMDGNTHGDDHFFPGPVDIAWDLAGAIIEWELDSLAADFLVKCYRKFSGDDPTPRLRAYRMAYLAFRLGFCKMAEASVENADEKARFRRNQVVYRRCLEDTLPPGAGPVARAS